MNVNVLLVQQIVEGLGTGSIYAALALALVLVFRSTRVVNFAQGEMAMFSVYLAYQLVGMGVPLFVALAIVAVLSFALGALVFQVTVRPLLGGSQESVVVVCIGLFVGFDALCLWIWGSDQRAFPEIFPRFVWVVGGVRFTSGNVGLLLLLAALAAALGAWFRWTKLGLSMRAAAAEREKSVHVGINVPPMLMLGWGIANVFGFIGSALVAPRLFLSPSMMSSVIIYALAAATLGGWDSPLGAVIGGLVVGVAESVGASFIPLIGADLKLAIPILITAFVLLLRPQGLLGTMQRVRV